MSKYKLVDDQGLEYSVSRKCFGVKGTHSIYKAELYKIQKKLIKDGINCSVLIINDDFVISRIELNDGQVFE